MYSNPSKPGRPANGPTGGKRPPAAVRRWLRGYLLMSPTMLVMLGMLIVPIVALILRSFWTQNVFALDTTFTLNNYRHLFATSDRTVYWMGIPFPFENAVYVILMIKSVLISLTATIAVVCWPIPWPISWSSA